MDKPQVKSQIAILYQLPDGTVPPPYSVAYDDRQAEEFIEHCEDKHGLECMPKAVEGLTP